MKKDGKKDRSFYAAFVLQLVALAFVVLLYLYLRGLADEAPPSPVILPDGGAEDAGGPADRPR